MSQQGWFLLRLLLLLCPHMYFSLCVHFPGVSFSFYKDTSPIGIRAPTLMTSFNINYLFKGPSSKHSHLGG